MLNCFMENFKDKDFTPYSSGNLLFSILAKIYPNMFSKSKLSDKAINMFNKVTGTDKILNALINKKSVDELSKISNKGLEEFKKLREKYLLYQ